MKKILAILIMTLAAVAGLAAPAFAAPAQFTPSGTLIASWNGTQLYNDWSHVNDYGGGGCNAGGSGNVAVTGGILRLTTNGVAGNCAEVWSPQQYWTNGDTIEARIWLQSTTGAQTAPIKDWPAFWASGTEWPHGGEIDAVEGLDGTSYVSYHNFQAGADCWDENEASYSTLPEADMTAPGCQHVNPVSTANFKPDEWVTVDIVTAPESFSVYYNGVLYATFSGPYQTGLPMNGLLDMAASQTSANGVPATMSVEYVKVYS